MYSVYIIKNIVNEKVYIGKTFKSLQERLADHINSSKKPKANKRLLYAAMNKYGIEKFYIECLECNLTDIQACEKESYYIQKYKSYIGFNNCNGYNMTLGGDGRSWTDYVRVVEVYLKNNKNQTKTAQLLGCSKKTVRRACKLLNVPIKANIKKVFLYDKDGSLLQEFPFLKDAVQFCINNNILGYDKLNRQDEWSVNNYIFKVDRN